MTHNFIISSAAQPFLHFSTSFFAVPLTSEQLKVIISKSLSLIIQLIFSSSCLISKYIILLYDYYSTSNLIG